MATPEGLQQRFQGGVKIGRLYLDSGFTLVTATGSNQGGAAQLGKDLQVIGTAPASSGVLLPGAEDGRTMVVSNQGANAVTVYSKETTGVDINGTAGSTGVSLGVGHTAIFICAGANWYAFGGNSI